MPRLVRDLVGLSLSFIYFPQELLDAAMEEIKRKQEAQSQVQARRVERDLRKLQ